MELHRCRGCGEWLPEGEDHKHPPKMVKKEHPFVVAKRKYDARVKYNKTKK